MTEPHATPIIRRMCDAFASYSVYGSLFVNFLLFAMRYFVMFALLCFVVRCSALRLFKLICLLNIAWIALLRNVILRLMWFSFASLSSGLRCFVLRCFTVLYFVVLWRFVLFRYVSFHCVVGRCCRVVCCFVFVPFAFVGVSLCFDWLCCVVFALLCLALLCCSYLMLALCSLCGTASRCFALLCFAYRGCFVRSWSFDGRRRVLRFFAELCFVVLPLYLLE